ncbi:hypothetical protein [Streptomyces sp. NPDC059071]|uniref:hypothetical protein n=1 Tax=unclassified Streptomyces TaxID=2593676 RepID=UPI0036601A40
MRLPFVSRRHAQARIAAATAGLRADLEATQVKLAAATRLPATETEMRCDDLEQRVKELLATVAELRAGVVDDAQTAELRRQLGIALRANRALEQRLYEMTLANQLHDQQLHAPKEAGQ